MTSRPVVLLQPFPQRRDVIFSDATWSRLTATFDVSEDPDQFDALLPEALAVIGQPDLPAERLARAGQLKAILNVEGNFFPNVDYTECFQRGVYVLGCGPAYAQPVAEYALGLAIDLARGITREDRAFRAGRERYTIDGNHDAILLRHSEVGFIGFGNLGRALLPLLRPFSAKVRVHDPWLPDSVLREADVEPATLDEVLENSTFIFVLAAVTDENQQLLDGARLDRVRQGARLILVSRAAVVDFPALYSRVEDGRFLAAIDVWPDEPVPANDPARALDGLVLSAHRAGGMTSAFHEIGEMVLDDLTQLARGLPPVRMQVASRELVGRYRSKPVIKE